jgi:hypothetical protein
MAVDPEYLRRHYSSLSDDALLEIDRAELVDIAQTCYDDELRVRKLSSPHAAAESVDKPDWLGEAAEVFSRVDVPGTAPAPDVANARDALEAAGIPCYLDVGGIPADQSDTGRPMRQWRLMVPGNLNLHATSILERDIFNVDFEAEWKTHLEMLSDKELSAMNPQVVFCGLFDRVERVTKTYDEEMIRRGLKSEFE